MTWMSCHHAIPRSFKLLAAAGLLLAGLGACASSRDREAYFESRSAVISAHPGNGVERVALWPSTAWGRSTVAVADRRSVSDSPRPHPAGDSAR